MAGSTTLQKSARKPESPIPSSILAKAIASRRGVFVNDVWESSTASETDELEPERQPEYRALLVTPIHRKEKLFGYLVLFYAEPRESCDDDRELGHLFGQQVTLALDNAELRSHAEKAAIENERNRLARDLHDAVTQTLFSASVVAEALPRVWERDPAEGRRALEDLRLWTRGALAELRSLLMELRPSALIEKPLPDLIRQLSEAAGPRLGIPVVCHLTSEAEPPAEVKLCLYRVAQEALNNIAKHSFASQVEIQYLALPHAVELTVVDNGRGFDVDRRSPGQLGLTIMRERTRHVRAKLAVRSAPDAGTEVRVEWRPRERKDSHE
jgi:signal transduction histidine kinase